MKTTTADQIEELLALSYGNRFNAGLVTVMEKHFAREPDEAIVAAVNACIGRHAWPPSIAEINEQMEQARVTTAQQQAERRRREDDARFDARQGAPKEFNDSGWQERFTAAHKHSDYCFRQASKHFNLNFIHPLRETRQEHHLVGIMIRRAIAERHEQEYTADDIIADVAQQVAAEAADE